ncbi:MAG: TIGR02117 family protein [Cardiobacterium sp.]|jgi:hypothetical protein|nr:MAG: TIGR02117 family protein [Cardiobacterium sp.]
MLRRLGKTLAALLVLPLAYLLAACVLGNIVREPQRHGAHAITIYLLDNGVHTDLALPLANDTFDWTGVINPNDARDLRFFPTYVAFGWGDRAFYLETPQWRDLKLTTAWNAISGQGATVIHATYLPPLRASANSIAITVSLEEYQALAASIRASFQQDDNGRARAIGRAYGDNDAFYAARGSYSLFATCNSWTNRQLKAAGLKHVLWTPFAHHLMQAYR